MYNFFTERVKSYRFGVAWVKWWQNFLRELLEFFSSFGNFLINILFILWEFSPKAYFFVNLVPEESYLSCHVLMPQKSVSHSIKWSELSRSICFWVALVFWKDVWKSFLDVIEVCLITMKRCQYFTHLFRFHLVAQHLWFVFSFCFGPPLVIHARLRGWRYKKSNV